MSTISYGLFSQAVVLSGGTLGDMIDLSSLSTYLLLGTAFAVIILLVVLILLAKIMSNLKEIRQAQKPNTVDNVIAQIAKHEEQELINDGELVAVITAAIYASLGDAVPVNGLVVRSVKKVDRRKRSNY